MEKYSNNQLRDIDTKITALILTSISTIIFLIVFFVRRKQLPQSYYNKEETELDDYVKIAFFILLAANIIFLYRGYCNLQIILKRYNTTGNRAGLTSAYRYLYGRSIQILGLLLVIKSLYSNNEN